MYALVKQSGKYDVVKKRLISNKNIQIYKDRQLIVYNDDVKLLKDIQKNLNTGIPQVLIDHINNTNENQLIRNPQAMTHVTKNGKMSVSPIDTSNISVKSISINIHPSSDKKQIERFKDQSTINKDVNNSSIRKQNDSTVQYISSFDESNIQVALLSSTPVIYGNNSYDSQYPIINDIFLNKDVSANFSLNIEQQYSHTSLESNKNEKCCIISNIALDQSWRIVKTNKTSIVIRKKSKDIKVHNNNSLDFSQSDNIHIYSKMDTESSFNRKLSFIRDTLDESKCINKTDISQTDPTYEPSQSDAFSQNLSANTSNKMLFYDNISPNEDDNVQMDLNEENENNISQNKSSDSSYSRKSGAAPGACDDVEMFVASSQGRSGMGKKNFCLYCKTFQSKIHRHLQRIHKDEADVQKFLDLPKGTTERKRIIDTIRRNGNFLFNTDPKYNNGELLVCRRPNPKMLRNAKDYQACINCKGYFSKITIRHHFRYCVGRSKKRNRSLNVLGRSITGRIHKAANPKLATVIFPVLREDRVTRIIRYDELLIKHANKLCDKYKLQHQHDMIRSRLRLLGRFLLALKSINPNIDNFTSLYDPKYYDDIIQAVNEVAGFNCQINTYKTPSNATNLGTQLKQVGNTLITECIKKSDYSTKQRTEDLLKLITEDYSASVARTALETQSQEKRKKKVVLPTAEDISKLYNYLKEKRRSCYNKLRTKFSYGVWLTLAKVTLVAIQVFNRRRAGETERILIEEFNNREAINEKTNYELFKSLSINDKKIAKKYARFVVRGKKNRDVPILLDNELTQCILLLIEHRKSAKIHPRNPYLFALPGKNIQRFKFLRACNVLREFSNECNAKIPTSLRGTKLRKHIATKCILLNLQDDEVSDLCEYMGHEKDIHKEYYRQPIISRDIVRMSQLLEKAQDGGEEESNSDDHIEGNESNDEEDTGCDTKLYDLNYNKTKEVTSPDIHENTLEHIDTSSQSINGTKRKRSTSPYGKTKRRRWNNKERNIVIKLFGKYIKSSHLPPTQDILTAIKTHKALQGRTAPQIRTWLHNQRKQKSNSFEADISSSSSLENSM